MKGQDIVTKGNATALRRHRDALVYLAKEADMIKLKIEGMKMARSEKMDQVCAWSDKIDKSIEGVDAEIEHLGKCLGEVKQKSQMAEKESEEATIVKEREQHLAFEKEKLKKKLEYEKKSEEFKKAQRFNSEGYERAKTILQLEYGKTSEIVHTYVSNIMGLRGLRKCEGGVGQTEGNKGRLSPGTYRVARLGFRPIYPRHQVLERYKFSRRIERLCEHIQEKE